MKVAILGTRGIPNNYGGFEQLAEFLSVALHLKGHEIFVYNSSLHPYPEKEYNGVKIIVCQDLENKIGTAGQFIYDYNCIIDSRKRDFDIIIQLGYTSSSIWGFLLPKKAFVITNMDGLEWKRSKYSFLVKQFLKLAELWAVKSSQALVADSKGIQAYLTQKYKVEPYFIAYGAKPFYTPNESILPQFQLTAKQYYLLIARIEPENNIETIIKGYVQSNAKEPLIIIGAINQYGKHLKTKYNNYNIKFEGSIYNLGVLNNLRYFCKMYFHGHTVGGTNPSLLEAMASQAFICANGNEFNQSVLENDGLYFYHENDIAQIINTPPNMELMEVSVANNLKKIEQLYTWPTIVNQYEQLLYLKK
ncbi:MAG: DUF1972 domain-containing protein [Bacteroidia bacterium]|nr:DUF1972 domain-containing protein [Bacteroidia bacterium]